MAENNQTSDTVVIHNAAEHRFENRHERPTFSAPNTSSRNIEYFLPILKCQRRFKTRVSAHQLAHGASEYTRWNGLIAVPVCPFVKKYVYRTPNMYSSGCPLRLVKALGLTPRPSP